MALSSNALVTVEDLTPYLKHINLTDVEIIPVVEELIEQTSAFISSHLGFNPLGSVDTWKDIQSINSNKILLPNSPVISISSLIINDYNYTPDVEGAELEYGFDSKTGIVTFYNRSFHGTHLVKINYTWGFSSLPHDIKQVVLELITLNYGKLTSNSFGIKSQVTGDSTTTYYDGLSWGQKSILDKYKK